MRMVVLGAGLQGSACVYDLLQDPAVEQVTLADMRSDALPPFLSKYSNDPRLKRVTLDARDEAALRATLRGHVSCMNALPYYFNLAVSAAAVDEGVHSSDLGGNTAIVFQQIELDAAAKAHGVSVIPDCGLAPGMVNILARAGIDEMDEARTVKIFVGGLPQQPKPPLNYQIVYSLHGVIDYYTTRSWVLRDGQPLELDALTEIEPVEFPAPVGTLEAFHTAGGLSTMAWTYQDKLESMEYKTLRYPGHAEAMRTIRDLGLLDTEPVRVGQTSVVPRDVFISIVEPRLKRNNAPDLVALRVAATGLKGGQQHQVTFDLIDRTDEATGISAMERTTGFSLSITGLMQARGDVRGAGVSTPDQAVPADRYIEELRRRGIDIVRSVG